MYLISSQCLPQRSQWFFLKFRFFFKGVWSLSKLWGELAIFVTKVIFNFYVEILYEGLFFYHVITSLIKIDFVCQSLTFILCPNTDAESAECSYFPSSVQVQCCWQAVDENKKQFGYYLSLYFMVPMNITKKPEN